MTKVKMSTLFSRLSVNISWSSNAFLLLHPQGLWLAHSGSLHHFQCFLFVATGELGIGLLGASIIISYFCLLFNLLTEHFLERSLKATEPQHSVGKKRNYSGWEEDKLWCQLDYTAGYCFNPNFWTKEHVSGNPFIDHLAQCHLLPA